VAGRSSRRLALGLDQLAFDQAFRDLDGVERRALAQIVGHAPQREAVLHRRILANAADIGNEHGKAFTPERFTKWFVSQCERAGLPGLSPHGLRKAACVRLAQAGCSAHEIASISGHASLAEVQRYCQAADQARMAKAAVERLRLRGT
jgi:integrase